MTTSTPADFLALGDERFVSLTTYRRNGEGVATPMWIARNGACLVVTTGAHSGKVKRLRRDPTVELRPCTRRGRVASSAPTVRGLAEIRADPASQREVARLICAKYGNQYRLVMLVERLLLRRRAERVALYLTAPAGP